MTISQLSSLKQWHVSRRGERPVELCMLDAVLTLWMIGWLGMPAGVLLWRVTGFVACGLLLLAPAGYVALRRRLHRNGRLRCDWLPALRT